MDLDRLGRPPIRERVEEKLRPLTLPNFLTLLRMAIVPFLVIAVADNEFRLALWIFVLAGATDALDGFLARRLEARSVVGAYLDPIADKLLLTAAYIALTVPLGQTVAIPLWLAILTLFRDFLIVLMAVVLYAVEGIKRFPPSILGKLTTLLQVVTITVVLVANVVRLPSVVPATCFYVSFALVVVSGFNYIYRASGMIEGTRTRRDGAFDEPPHDPPSASAGGA